MQRSYDRLDSLLYVASDEIAHNLVKTVGAGASISLLLKVLRWSVVHKVASVLDVIRIVLFAA